LICFALAKSGKVPGLAPVYDPGTGHATQVAGQAAFPMMVKYMLPRPSRHRRGRITLRADGFPGGVFNACSPCSPWICIRSGKLRPASINLSAWAHRDIAWL